MSILTIVQDAALLAGFQTVPNSAVGSSDQNILQLVAFAKRSGRELVERANWVKLDTAGKVAGDGVSTLFSLPADWVRFSPSDKSPHGALVSSKFPLLPLVGPINTEDLNLLKALPASTVRPVWRIIGSALEIWPALAAAENVTFNYYSSAWIMPAAGPPARSTFTMDSDTSLINEDTITLGALWRWKASKGLDYAEEFRAYEASFVRNAAQQQTERTVSTSSVSAGDYGAFYGTITDLSAPLL